jgi:NitT/TauT family transport system substrate-binding protein
MRLHQKLSITVSLLLACFSASVTKSLSADTVRVIVTGQGSPLQWPLFIGISKGFFKAQNIEIDLVAAQSSASMLQQLTAGAGDLGQGGVIDPIRAIDRGGAKLSMLMIEASKAPYSLWGKPNIKSIAELKGKIVSTGLRQDLTTYFFEIMAAANGLSAKDYEINTAATTPTRYAALVSGAVDAAILYPPASYAAPRAGYSNLGELATYLKEFTYTAYSVNLAWAKTHEVLIRNFIKAYLEGVTWFYQPENREGAIDILVKASRADRGDVEQTYNYFTSLRLYPEKAEMRPQDIAQMLKMMQDKKDLDGPADGARFIDPTVNAMLPK